jgi:hypothetical protein
MGRRATLRASDQDREHVAERLRHAVAEGRLLAEEFEHRLARALRARTYGELDQLVADLPGDRAGVVRRRRSVSPAVAVAGAVGVAVLAVAVLALAALIVTGIAAAWAVWMFLAWFVFGCRPRRRAYHHHRRAQVRYAHRRSLP